MKAKTLPPWHSYSSGASAMHECSKAVMRRMRDPAFLLHYFVGKGLDVGAGNDPLANYTQFFPKMQNVRAWDVADGDAQFLGSLLNETFDFVHSSHCLEHVHDPGVALGNWLRVLKPGGHLIVLIPDEDLYEQGVWPSTYNPDHKWTFTLCKKKSWSPVSRNVLDLVKGTSDLAEPLRIELLHASFRHGLGRIDQTLSLVGECAIEFVLRKHGQKRP